VEGKVIFYHVDGKVNATGNYVNDLKDGEWKYYKEDGKLQKTDKYINGKLMTSSQDFIPKEQVDKEKKNAEQYEIKDPYSDKY
jgi:antitoxin component YwqK of YwqJK toxin-antitoxin module